MRNSCKSHTNRAETCETLTKSIQTELKKFKKKHEIHNFDMYRVLAPGEAPKRGGPLPEQKKCTESSLRATFVMRIWLPKFSKNHEIQNFENTYKIHTDRAEKCETLATSIHTELKQCETPAKSIQTEL